MSVGLHRQQYVSGAVRVRRAPTTLRERRCHNCRPTKMTCSPVNLGRVDSREIGPNFPLAELKATLHRESLPRENKTQTNTNVSIDTVVQWLRLIFSGLISTSASHALPCGRRDFDDNKSLDAHVASSVLLPLKALAVPSLHLQ